MATTTCVPMKTGHPPGPCSMLTTVPPALPALTAVPHPGSPTPVAMPNSTPIAGHPPLTTALSPPPLALPPQLAPTQPASCPMRTMRSSTPTLSLGQPGTLPTGWATLRLPPLAWSGPRMRRTIPLASTPRPLGSPTPPSIRTTASDSSSACRLTCRDPEPGWGISAGQRRPSQLFPDIQGRCSSLPAGTSLPPPAWQVGSRSPGNTTS